MEPPIPPGPPGSLAGVLVLFVCLLGVAFFSSSEAAIISVNKLRIRSLADKGSQAAETVQRLVGQHDRLFGTILLLENFLIISVSSLFTVFAMRYERAQDARWAVLAASVCLTFFIAIVAEIAPKTFAAQHAERHALVVARPMHAVMLLAWPAVWAVTSLSNALVAMVNGLFRLGDRIAPTLVTRDEIRLLVDVGGMEGDLASEETEMIQSIFALGDTTAREIMVPRIDMVSLPEEATFDSALQIALTEGHSRIPLYRESPDNITGILYVKDLLAFLQSDERPKQIPLAYIRPAYYIPESKRVDDLLREMRRERLHLAIVMDEYGGTAGLVTIEDILEEIVGEIQDEYDLDEALPIEHQPDGSVIVDGRLGIEAVNEALDLSLPDEEFDTLGGFVVGLLGRAPAPGESVTYQTLFLVAESVKQRRLTRVRIYRSGTGPLPEAEAGTEDAHP